MAVCLLAGYVWLVVAGVTWLVAGDLHRTDAVYDVALHAVFLGFVMSMIFAHAPVIVPAVLRVRLPFRRWFYGHAVLLHAALFVRLVVGDGLGSRLWWQIGGTGTEVAVLLFICSSAIAVLRARRAAPAGAPPGSAPGSRSAAGWRKPSRRAQCLRRAARRAVRRAGAGSAVSASGYEHPLLFDVVVLQLDRQLMATVRAAGVVQTRRQLALQLVEGPPDVAVLAEHDEDRGGEARGAAVLQGGEQALLLEVDVATQRRDRCVQARASALRGGCGGEALDPPVDLAVLPLQGRGQGLGCHRLSLSAVGRSGRPSRSARTVAWLISTLLVAVTSVRVPVRVSS